MACLNELAVALCHFCEHHGPNVIFYTRLKQPNETGPSKFTQTNKNCIACNPIGIGHPGFASRDPDSHLETASCDRYISEGHGNRLRQAAFRSLSSEVTPAKEGPLFFNDLGIGIHVISHTFFLKDSSARGFQRWFSIVVVGSESDTLLASWNPLLSEIKANIHDLQQMSSQVYQMEEQNCSHRLLRSKHNHLNVGAARALQDLTSNPEILVGLHTRFSRILLLTAASRGDKVSSSSIKNRIRSSISDGQNVEKLIQICSALDPQSFQRLMKHVLRGGSVYVSSSNLTLGCSVVEALQLLVPVATHTSFKVANHKLPESHEPCLLVNDWGKKITCVWNRCPTHGKVSYIVTQLEHVIFAEDIPHEFVLRQLSRIWNELVIAAERRSTLRATDDQKIVQFFQSHGYDFGDMAILDYWSSQINNM